MTDSIKAIEKIVLTSDDDEKQIRSAYAMAGLIGKYQKLIETTDLVERIEKLEQNYESIKQSK
ncbi:hypothetical protein [Rhodohalobacter sulfatireducens]|uniref:DUF1843 domain-containing protein n=1 Tax=Rhodohalobacter sulfatireducens TaxID=2911366 RepID=A0ABS9KHX8_9BACT|nr:hypothetical protein [Rhodohalobacter sulfatireducens]MCG2590392.1 hypothetical protein [Rhodohalobacter sulfatireducens]